MAEERTVLRRRHSTQLKAQVLAQCAEPGASVAKVAMSHALNANIVHGWRKLARERDGAGGLAPGRVALLPESAAVRAGVDGADTTAVGARRHPHRASSRRHIDEAHLADRSGGRLRGLDA